MTPDEWMDPDHVMVVLDRNEQRVVWNAVTSLRRRTAVDEIRDTCSAIREKLASTKFERPAQGSQSSGLQGRQTSPSGPLEVSHGTVHATPASQWRWRCPVHGWVSWRDIRIGSHDQMAYHMGCNRDVERLAPSPTETKEVPE